MPWHGPLCQGSSVARRHLLNHLPHRRLTVTVVVVLLIAAGLIGLPMTRLMPVKQASPDHARQATAAIVVTQGQTATPISPLLYGLGAGVSPSTYNPPLPGIATRLGAAIRLGGATALRFGAGSADDFDWETSQLYPENGTRPEHVGTAMTAHAGIDTFLSFAGKNDLQPILVVNAEIDDPQQAARLVEYTETQGMPVTYWEIGNEPYQWTHFAISLPLRRANDQQQATPDQYAAIVIAYAQAMQAVARRYHHTLHIIADEWISNATDQSWTNSVSIVDTHYYSFFGPDNPPTDAAIAHGSFTDASSSRPNVTEWLVDLRTTLQGFSGSENLHMMIGSWGLDGGTAPSNNNYADFEQALFIAQMLGQMAQNGVVIADAYPFYGEEQAPIDEIGNARAGLYAMSLYTHDFGHWLLPSQPNAAAASAHLWALAGSTASHDGDVTLLVVNDAIGHDVTATVSLNGTPATEKWQPEAAVWTLQHDQPNGAPAYGTSGIQQTQRHLSFSGTSFIYRFPPDSITLLRLHHTIVLRPASVG